MIQGNVTASSVHKNCCLLAVWFLQFLESFEAFSLVWKPLLWWIIFSQISQRFRFKLIGVLIAWLQRLNENWAEIRLITLCLNLVSSEGLKIAIIVPPAWNAGWVLSKFCNKVHNSPFFPLISPHNDIQFILLQFIGRHGRFDQQNQYLVLDPAHSWGNLETCRSFMLRICRRDTVPW